MPGTVTSANGDRGTIRLESGPELETRVDGIGPGERCHAVVRPEKLLIHHASERLDGGLPSVEGLVESSVYLGTSTQIVVRLTSGRLDDRAGARTPSEAERARLPGGGPRCRLRWAPEHMHVVRDSTATTVPADDQLPEPNHVPEQATA